MIRDGMESPISNKLTDKNWEKKINKLKLDPTLNWKIAEVTGYTDNEIQINIIDKKGPSKIKLLVLRKISGHFEIKNLMKDLKSGT